MSSARATPQRVTPRRFHHQSFSKSNRTARTRRWGLADYKDEKQAFDDFMKLASIRSRVKLGQGDNGRGLFSTSPVGRQEVALLLEVPIDVAIVCPIGDGSPQSTDKTAKAIVASWEKRNAPVPEPIKDLIFSQSGEDRELGVVLWLIFAMRAGGKVWEAYADWLPTKTSGLPSLLLADESELLMTQNKFVYDEAMRLRQSVAKFYDRIPFGAVPGSVSLDDLMRGFALVTSRAISAAVGETPDGDDDTAVAVLAPCIDMANHVDSSKVTALKKLGASDGGGIRGAYWRVMSGGSVDGGGGACVLETFRPIERADEEITISYQPCASNDELIVSYGFALPGNRNDRLSMPELSKRLRIGALRQAVGDQGLMSDSTDEDEARRIIAAVESACSIAPGINVEDGDWELDQDAAQAELDNAVELSERWERELNSFPTSLEQDEEELAEGRDYPTSFGFSALFYRMERKRLLETGLTCMNAYVDWLSGESPDEGAFVVADGEMPAGM